MNIAVIGTGEIGLSTAILLAYMDHFVVMVDDSQTKIDQLRTKSLRFHEPLLNEVIDLVDASLSFTTNLTTAIEASDIVYYTGSRGYSKMEVCRIFGGALKKRHRILVNKTKTKTSEMNLIIRQFNTTPSTAYEVPFIKIGSMIEEMFFPQRIVIGTSGFSVERKLKNIYSPIITQSIMLPDFITRPPKYSAPKVTWTDIDAAEGIG